MTAETVYTGAQVVARDRVFDGTVRVRDGAIAEVEEGRSALPGAVDLAGDLLIPGLVELHTDNVEKHFLPRPKVMWPSGLAAVLAHDAQIVSSGITTVFDALSVGDYRAGGQRKEIYYKAVEAIRLAAGSDLFRAEHMLHMRCELSDPYLLEMFEPYAGDPLVRFVSLMDHTPGQRQWTDIQTFRTYLGDGNPSDEDLRAEVAERQVLQKKYAPVHRGRVLELCRGRACALASHDDTLEEHVLEAVADGLTISEFPTTRTAADRARAEGMRIVMGAPNIVRGGSHSGNVSAVALADAGLLDCLSSDYVPASLLHGAFMLAGRPGIDLSTAVGFVTANPAEMAGLTDRGEIAAGKRADLVRVRMAGDLPVVRQVWRAGERIL
jgi:alpha-D-ribose 1-methylphosphonate 5-triphosphate diphosphatase